jgi:hypothetical protein
MLVGISRRRIPFGIEILFDHKILSPNGKAKRRQAKRAANAADYCLYSCPVLKSQELWNHSNAAAG